MTNATRDAINSYTLPMHRALKLITKDTQENANRVATLLDGMSSGVKAALAKMADLANDLSDEYAASLAADMAEGFDPTSGNQAEIDLANFEAAEYEARTAAKIVAPVADAMPTTPGMFRLTDGVYVVKWNLEKTRLYAKKLVGASFEYAAGAMRDIRESNRMSVDECEALSLHIGCCCFCGRTLTVAKSVKAGMGPVCRKRVAGL